MNIYHYTTGGTQNEWESDKRFYIRPILLPVLLSVSRCIIGMAC